MLGAYKHGKVDSEGEPCKCMKPDCMVCRIFDPHKQPKHNLGPTRILFRDARLTDDSKRVLAGKTSEGMNYAEIKTENIINRATGVATSGGLRTQERVPAGSEFEFNIVLRIFEGDDEEGIEQFIEEGIKLLQNESLGSSGSRGYGEIKISPNGEYRVSA